MSQINLQILPYKLSVQCCIPSFKIISCSVLEKIFEGFYHIWAWQSCDNDRLKELSFPRPMEVPHKIWLQLAQWFLRSCLKMFRKRFLKVFTIYGHGGHMTMTVWKILPFPDPWRFHIKFRFNWPSGFWGDVWQCWQTDGRLTTGTYLFYKH